jgi:hypothetical protein
MKSNLTQEEFLSHVEKIYKHQDYFRESMKEIGRLRDVEYKLGKKLFYKDKKLKAVLDVLFREESSPE